ncbi:MULTISPECIES: hypothetical protein [Methylomonas]|uniref:Uncharacterized protein n=2 Tax=Methylomonas TaxID=416 RepID=A0A126T483_9GAMM|nr:MULTISPECIES: hypothetical protein [Methylomonas]AMK76893.1 hypothetical protein JT25_010400 [Methylomonas denitrificans]OAI09140.1 hypothetical protein A1342_19780 [Methylomonas methanica]TCV74198.1 hypothetical protein EDE11_13912 [Methylomonas methanica]
MSSTESININSLHELQLQMPRIVQAVNANPGLALAAAANPLLALEQLGYKLSSAAREEVEQYARFGPDNLKRLAEIETEFGKLLTTKTMPADLSEAHALFEKSGYEPSDKSAANKKATLKPAKNQGLATSLAAIFAAKIWAADEEKKLLRELSAQHPGLLLLYQYRKIHRQRPAFATRSAFETILAGEKNTLVDQVEFSLNRHRDTAKKHLAD